MALLFCDGFDSYTTTNDVLRKWATVTTPWAWSSTAGPAGRGCMVGTANNGAQLSSVSGVIPASTTRWCMGWWIKISAFVNSANFLNLYTNIGVNQFSFRMTTGGVLNMWNNSAAVYMQGVRNITDNQWHWIEIDINTVNASVLKLYIDGVQEFNGVQTGAMNSTFIDRFIFPTNNSMTTSIANVVLWDNVGSGLTAASFPLGPRDIATIRPNGDSAVQFTRSTGSTNYSLVDEVGGDIADYVESGTSGQQDLYDYAALGFTPASINAVMVNSLAHNPAAGTINHQAVCKSGATTSVGTSRLTPAITPATNLQAYDLDPNGNIAWTGANLDAAQFGIKVV